MNDLNIPDAAVKAAAGEVEYYGVDRADREKAAREALAVAAPLVVAAELERIAETLRTSCRVDDLMATIEAGARNGVRNELLARAAELRSGDQT